MTDQPARKHPYRTSPNRRIEYLERVIAHAAERLRAENVAHLVATDLEDSLLWSLDPSKCRHPYSNCRTDGTTVCRTCGTASSHIDSMGG